MLNDTRKYSVTTNQLYAELPLAEIASLDKLDTMLILDGDRTLITEDTGTLFWKAVSDTEPFDDEEDLHKTVFTSDLKYSHAAFRQAILLFEDVAFRLGRDVFEAICNKVVEAATFRTEFKSILKLVAQDKGVGAVVVTCGHRLIWEKVLKKANVSEKIKVIGGGTLGSRYVVTPSVKRTVVTSLRARLKCYVWAFGDGVVDLEMLREADQAVVVVGEEHSRSKTMDLKLPPMLTSRVVKARQLLLPRTVTPRLNIETLPVVNMTEIEDQINSSYMTTLQHATDKGASQLLMAHTRDAANHGPALQESHRQVGRYLAMEYLPAAIGLETYLIPHVQAGKSAEASRILHEDKTLIIALMRGGLPMAEGIHQTLPQASMLHAKNPADVGLEHLAPQSAVILADSVINNGTTIRDFVQHIRALAPTMSILVVAGVVQVKSVSRGGLVWNVERQYGRLTVVALRLSENKYTGKGTTDTGNRLFNTTYLQK